jgi:phage gp29-like protein
MSLLTNIFNRSTPAPVIKEGSKAPIIPLQMLRIRQDVTTRKAAIDEAERAYFPYRVKLQQMYVNTRENAFIRACIDRRKDLTLLRKWEFKNANNEIDDNLTNLFCETIAGKTQVKSWFYNYINTVLDAIYYGYSLVYLGDIVNGEFPYIAPVKRQNISPDRYNIGSFPYMTVGVDFLTDEQYKDWYIYASTPNELGTSPCGYGLFWELSIYEIFLRNLVGFNGDFVELFAQPFRVGRTNKTEEYERAAFESTLSQMGSSGYAILDDIGDSIEFIETSLGGSGYKGYADFETRLEAKCSQLILGHADAIKSVPGKLGTQGEGSPAETALLDKQTKDAAYLLPYVNKVLFDKMRSLGFNIPDGSVACMMNDNEENEIAGHFADMAVKMKQAGLQMDAEYFTEKTGIPVAQIQAPQPINPIPQKAQNKLNLLYGK